MCAGLEANNFLLRKEHEYYIRIFKELDGKDWKEFHRLMSLGIIEAQLRDPLKPLGTIEGCP